MKKILLLGLLISILLITGCGEKVMEGEEVILKWGEISGEVYIVVIENGKFNPMDLEVKVGDTIEWVNKDGKSHTVTFEDVRIDEELPDRGITSYTFTEAEEVRYFCRFHSGMQGSVMVS